ncbi:CGNR zinc finger domain-containing protein [Streptomyces sp. NPDC059009]|uniref:CGNR zinc finger domain-containing protein n=1 Tax=Streptomyces sp. NPDC059009 TaxID=3346694 RepID=UPI00369AD4CE
MREPPPSAQLIEAFANTLNLEYGTDDLSTPGHLADWLVGQGLLDRLLGLDAGTHAQYLQLRGGIREELGVHVGVTPVADAVEAADAVLRTVPLYAGVRSTTLSPNPDLVPEHRPLAALAAAWMELRVTGDVLRLKRCAEHTCELVFWDLSKNRSRRWCSMRVCGNRAKSRAYAARQAAD